MNPETLATEWLILFNTNIGKAISRKEMLYKYREIDEKCEDLSQENKQIFHALIHKGIKQAMPVKEFRHE